MDPVCFICKNILKGFYVASSRVVVGGSWCFAIFHYGPLDDEFGRFVAINLVARLFCGWLIVKSGEERFLCCASGWYWLGNLFIFFGSWVKVSWYFRFCIFFVVINHRITFKFYCKTWRIVGLLQILLNPLNVDTVDTKRRFFFVLFEYLKFEYLFRYLKLTEWALKYIVSLFY